MAVTDSYSSVVPRGCRQPARLRSRRILLPVPALLRLRRRRQRLDGPRLIVQPNVGVDPHGEPNVAVSGQSLRQAVTGCIYTLRQTLPDLVTAGAHTEAISDRSVARTGLTDLRALPCVESEARGPLDFIAAHRHNDDKRDPACA